MKSTLSELVNEWRRWAENANKDEAGWQTDFPRWSALISHAERVMQEPTLDQETLCLLAECWAASEEDEELLEFAREHVRECWPALQRLADSQSPACRWQVYEATSAAGGKAEDLLRKGLADKDPYARRRAILALARLAPLDSRTLAEELMNDVDPYVRQAAIELVMVVADPEYRTRALDALSRDSADHVRDAARRRLSGSD